MHDYYVYVHKRADDGTVFYVGHGRCRRAFVSKNRTVKWKQTVEESNGYSVEFLHKDITKQQAILYENNYLSNPNLGWNLVNVNPAQEVIKLSKDELSEYFYVDSTSPSGLRWKKSFSRKNKAGDVAGNLFGYWKVGFKNKVLRVHRVIATIYFGDFDTELVINHKDCNPENNNIDNLEIISQSENSRKTKQQVYGKLRPDNRTGAIGVYRIENRPYAVTFVYRWIDNLGMNRVKKFNTNNYDSEEFALEAAIKYKQENEQSN